MAIFQLADFGIEDMLVCSTAVRTAGDGARSMEATTGTIVRYLRDSFIDKATGEPSLALVRFYKVLPFERLEPELQAVAQASAPELGSLAGVQCLTLLGTAGDEPAWNDRRASKTYRVVPLPDVESIERMPMLAALIDELGVDPGYVVHPDLSRSRGTHQRDRKVFYVPEAQGSPFVPEQADFVVPYGIRSVLGVGGLLPSGALFAIVLFSKEPIPRETAEGFAVVAVSAKAAVLPFVERRVFDSDPFKGPADPLAEADLALRIAESQIDGLELLLDVREQAVAIQTTRLNQALEEAHTRAEELAVSQAELAASEARTTSILSGALDAIISMGADGRVLEFNRAAETTFGYSRGEALGQLLAELIIPARTRHLHTEGLKRYIESGDGRYINQRVEVTAMRRDGSELPMELTITPVIDARPPSFTGYLRDITVQKAATAEVLASRARLAHIAHTLQASLLPPELPEVPRLAVASVYRPAGEGNDVGGDFYDVFELGDTRWALVLGDVCGKGPEAAAITALARYTIRAAAVRRPSDPAGVLAELHDAMVRQRPDSFCTVAYAVVEPEARRADIVMGGHPSALRVTGDGIVTKVGGRGPLLGMVDAWHGASEAVELEVGDTLVLYSDGVTEARRGKDLFGEDRLLQVVGDAAGGSPVADRAQAVASALEQAVVDFAGQLGDDVAILAVTCC